MDSKASFKREAYMLVRNYICSQIAFEQAKLESALYDRDGNADYISERYCMIASYSSILNCITKEKDKIIK